MPGRARRPKAASAIMAAVSPMAPAEQNADQSIPLLCSVCSKVPKFSDVSHLLTHFNSKGHLHSLQQVKLRALSDDAANTQLADFTAWYNQHNIDNLLAERLAAKDQKEAGKRKRARNVAPIQKSSKPKSSISTPVKREPDDADDGCLVPRPANAMCGNLHSHRERQDTFNEALFQTPHRQRIPHPFDERLDDRDVKHPILSPNGPSDCRHYAPMCSADDALDSSKLKGTVFPDIELERVRDIYASPSIEGSPVSPKEEPKKKRKRAAVLSERSTNLPFKNAPKGIAKQKSAKRQTGVRTRASAQQVAKIEKEDTPSLGGSVSGRSASQLSYDVFRDESVPTSRATSTAMIPENRFELRTRIPLQSLNPNAASNSNLASPTPIAKQSSVRHIGANENNHAAFQDSQTNEEFFTPGSHHLSDVGSLNPLCMPGREYALQGFNAPAFRGDMRTHTAGFQPINGIGYGYQLTLPGHDGLGYEHDHFFGGEC